MNLCALLIDGFSRIEVKDEPVVSIIINSDVLKEIRHNLSDCFDPYTRDTRNTDLGELKGSLYGASVYLDPDIKYIMLIGEHGNTITVSIPEDVIIDTQNKFKFIYERIE